MFSPRRHEKSCSSAMKLNSTGFMAELQQKKRVMGIEPTYPAWKAGVLPLNYTRIISDTSDIIPYIFTKCKSFLRFFKFMVTVQPARYFSHPRRSKRRMFGLNLSFSEKKYQNSGLAPYGLGRTQAFQGKKFQNSG